jgi:hypothetical protein
MLKRSLSNVAFNFNLRRYILGLADHCLPVTASTFPQV